MNILNFVSLPFIFLSSPYLFACISVEQTDRNSVQINLDSILNESLLEEKFNKPLPIPTVEQLLKAENYSNIKKSQVLILGGGYSPSGNQISLESNVKYFRKVQFNIGLDNAQTYTYFADGRDKGRDLQFFDPNFKVPQINLIIASLFNKEKGISNQYRSSNINANGPASIENLDNWINLQKRSNKTEQNLIYFTGHGGKGDSKNPHNTSIFLWNNARIKVVEFTKKLDSLSTQQTTILIMVQCYSGGFANILFKDGDPKKELSKNKRAGFFSTIQSRVAAGCTPDIREENYQEYSTSFWEALSGISRTGRKIKKPDYNSDGFTSLVEAHSYVCINSNTIDIPTKTSDVLLRKYTSPKTPKTSIVNKASKLINKYLNQATDLNSSVQKKDPKISLNNLTKSNYLNLANPEEKAVFLGLYNKLELKDEHPENELKKLQSLLKHKRDSIQKEKKKAIDERNKIRDVLRKKLISKYPELSNPFHPTSVLLLSTQEKEQVFNLVSQENAWDNFNKLRNKVRNFESHRFSIEKKEVKIIRLRRCMENIVLAKQLLDKGTEQQNKDYKKVLKIERTVFNKENPTPLTD